MVYSARVGEEINNLWAIIAASLLIVASAALVLVVEGATRRRIVSSGSARYVTTVLGAVAGVFLCGHALGSTSGNEWFGTEGFLLSGVDLGVRAASDAPTQGSLIVHTMAIAIVFSAIVAAAVAERVTISSHLVLGLVSGGVIVPLLMRALEPAGLLGSVHFGEAIFTDSAASMFALAGWFALIGSMVVGPRLGRVGSTGDFRAIPGKSPALVSAGTLAFVASSVGFVSLPEPLWVSEVGSAIVALLLAGASGAIVSMAVGYRTQGVVSGLIITQGLIAGLVATTGAPLETSAMAAVILGAIGGGIGVLASLVTERIKIDDPVGVIGIFGAAGIWGSLGAKAFDTDQFFAQLVGQLIVAAAAIVAAGVLFATLRLTRILRLRPELELVGLDD